MGWISCSTDFKVIILVEKLDMRSNSNGQQAIFDEEVSQRVFKRRKKGNKIQIRLETFAFLSVEQVKALKNKLRCHHAQTFLPQVYLAIRSVHLYASCGHARNRRFTGHHKAQTITTFLGISNPGSGPFFKKIIITRGKKLQLKKKKNFVPSVVASSTSSVL